jgi:hypothetical protein
MKKQPATDAIELVGFLFRFRKDDFDMLKEIVGADSFVKDIENAVRFYISERSLVNEEPKAAEIIQAMKRASHAAKKLDEAVSKMHRDFYWRFYEHFEIREIVSGLMRDLDSALQHALDDFQPPAKSGAPKKHAQDRLALRIRETLEAAGCSATTTADGDWATVFDLCLQATGLELKDPTSVLKKVRAKGKYSAQLLRVFYPH